MVAKQMHEIQDIEKQELKAQALRDKIFLHLQLTLLPSSSFSRVLSPLLPAYLSTGSSGKRSQLKRNQRKKKTQTRLYEG